MPRTELQKLEYKRRISKGLCTSCGEYLGSVFIKSGRRKCQKCCNHYKEYITNRNKNLVALGICVSCTKKKIYSGRLCKTCYTIRINQQRLKKESVLWRCARARAKRKDIEFKIDVSDIVIPAHCPLLGIKLEKQNNNVSDNSPTLDRIDNSKGYVVGNIMVISFKANRIKSNATFDELSTLVENLGKTLRLV